MNSNNFDDRCPRPCGLKLVNKPTNPHPIATIALTLFVEHQEEHPACTNCVIRCGSGCVE